MSHSPAVIILNCPRVTLHSNLDQVAAWIYWDFRGFPPGRNTLCPSFIIDKLPTVSYRAVCVWLEGPDPAVKRLNLLRWEVRLCTYGLLSREINYSQFFWYSSSKQAKTLPSTFFSFTIIFSSHKQKNKLCGLSPQANYTEPPPLVGEVSSNFCG
jgi:hypothetical protein